MVGMGIVFLQMHYIRNKDLGFNREQVISIPFKGQQAQQRARTLQTELKRNPDIISTGTANVKLGQQLGRTNILPEGKPTETNYITSIMAIDESFIPTMGIQLIQGRNFSTAFPADSASSMIINEEMARLLDWSDPIGKTIRLETGPQTYASYQVVGMVKDFHFATIRHKVEPVFMLYNKNNSQLAVKINTAKVSQTLDFIERTWKQINTETPYEYNFLDEDFANLYRSEQTFATMFSHFTLLALFIAVLGLLGLSAFTAQQRRKEISIRKVLGANVSQIMFLLSKDFLRLVLIAIIIAIPVAWYFMKKWLEDFAYQTDINPLIFVGAALTAILVAMFTVSYLSYKAAQANPVKSLRSE
jgi:putative ABC transport system permease protein